MSDTTDAPAAVEDPTRVPSGTTEATGQAVTSPSTPWLDQFVMVHANVLGRLNPFQLVELIRLKRMEDVVHRDICQKVTRLTDVTGLRRDTLRRHLDPTATETREPGVLTPWLRLRSHSAVHGRGDDGEIEFSDQLIHEWENESDGEEQWRIDVTPVRFVQAAAGQRNLATAEDRFVRVPFWWLWEPPSEAGDAWVPQRYPMPVTKKSRTGPVEKDVLAEAVFGAFVVAATPTGRYGISGLATIAGVSTSQMNVYLKAAEHAGLISVRHRRGGRQAIRRAVRHPNRTSA